MNASDLKGNLPGFIDPSVVFVFGSNYAATTLAWLQGPFYDFFKQRLFDDSLQTWRVGWECRDFSRDYACYAQECNALTPSIPRGVDILAVGEVAFVPDADRYGTKLMAGSPPGGRHDINMALVETGWVFIDPQTNVVWEMSEAELKSIFFLLF
jgi:hypothetical protein